MESWTEIRFALPFSGNRVLFASALTGLAGRDFFFFTTVQPSFRLRLVLRHLVRIGRLLIQIGRLIPADGRTLEPNPDKILENLLHETRPDVASDHFANGVNTPQASRPHGQAAEGDEEQARNQSLPRDVDDPGASVLSNEVALLCLSAAGREPQYFGPSSALSFSQIASTVMGLPRSRNAGSSQYNNEGQQQPAHSARSVEYPSPSKVELLSQAYFGNIHTQYPFLHRPTIEMMQQECLEASLNGSLQSAGATSLFFVFMVITPHNALEKPAYSLFEALCDRLTRLWEGRGRHCRGTGMTYLTRFR